MRHRSVTAAAKDLHLTQSTVSRLIKSLEEQLGKPLFTRQRKKLIPDAAAEAYAEDIKRGLDTIQRASMSLIANPGGGTLSLSVLPTFATRWLAPRLNDFLGQHPGVLVNLTTRFDRFNFDAESFDAAIYFGHGDWPDAAHLKLFDETYTACASAAFLAAHPITAPQDLDGLPMLQLASRPSGWQDWFMAQNNAPTAATGMVMDQFSMMIQAAIAGIGIALLPSYLARTEIDEGRLQPVLAEALPASGAYWLAWPEDKAKFAPLSAFRDWLEKPDSKSTGVQDLFR